MSNKTRREVKRDIKEAERQELGERIVELRRTGATWEMIASALGYAHASGAYNAYQNYLSKTVAPKIEEYRAMEIDLLDRLQLTLYERAKQGELKAISTVLQISDRRARILGLDAPTKIQAEVVTYDGNALEQHTARIIEIVRQTRDSESDLGSGAGEAGAVTE